MNFCWYGESHLPIKVNVEIVRKHLKFNYNVKIITSLLIFHSIKSEINKLGEYEITAEENTSIS